MTFNGIIFRSTDKRFVLSPDSFKKKKKEYMNLMKFTSSLKVSSYPARVQILLFLRESGCDFESLKSSIGCAHNSTLSAQLRTMRFAGLIQSSRDSQVVTYDLTERGRQISDIVYLLVNS